MENATIFGVETQSQGKMHIYHWFRV